MHIRRYLPALAGLLLLTACSTSAGSNPGPSSGGGGQGSANTSEGYDGSLTSSGKYAATWTVPAGTKATVFNSVESVELISDHQAYGTITVQPDGSVSLGSAAQELSPNLTFKGAGATVTLDSSSQFVCAFTVDTDLAGTRDGAILHVKGAMTVHWHPQGIGDVSCP